MAGSVQYGEGWNTDEGCISWPIDAKSVAARLKRGKKVVIVYPPENGLSARVTHDPTRNYLRVDIDGWPDDARCSSSLRYELASAGEVRLAEVGIYSKVPDPNLGERAFWNQFVHITPPEHKRAMLDLPAAATRYIKSLAGKSDLEELAALRFTLPKLDGYDTLVRPDLVTAAMYGLEAFDPALADVREIHPDDIPPETARP